MDKNNHKITAPSIYSAESLCQAAFWGIVHGVIRGTLSISE